MRDVTARRWTTRGPRLRSRRKRLGLAWKGRAGALRGGRRVPSKHVESGALLGAATGTPPRQSALAAIGAASAVGPRWALYVADAGVAGLVSPCAPRVAGVLQYVPHGGGRMAPARLAATRLHRHTILPRPLCPRQTLPPLGSHPRTCTNAWGAIEELLGKTGWPVSPVGRRVRVTATSVGVSCERVRDNGVVGRVKQGSKVNCR